MKNILSMFCLFNILFLSSSCLESCYMSFFDEDLTLTYSLIEDGSGYNLSASNSEYYNEAIKNLIVPSEYEGLPVVKISNVNSDNLISVEIPSTVKTLENVFNNCPKLEEITISEGVEVIRFSSFSNCPKLENITLPSTIKEISKESFENNYLKSITIENNPIYKVSGNCIISIENNSLIKAGLYPEIPDTIESIDEFAFHGNTSIVDLVIPDSVKNIYNSAFKECYNLKSVVIPKNCTSIGTYGRQPFINCPSLESIFVEEGNSKYYSSNDCNAIIDKNNNEIIVGCMNTVIPEGVISINDFAFSYCSNLQYIKLPESLVSIGYSAFSHCTSLKEIKFPKNLEYIADSAFEYCSNLRTIELPSNITSIGESAFTKCTALKEVDFKANVSEIAAYLFNDCSGLTTIEIPTTVEKIGKYSFSGCSKLLKLIIPENITSVGYRAFYDCNKHIELYNLSNVELTEEQLELGYTHTSDTLLGGSFFPSNKELITNVYNSLDVPSKITYIDDYAFINEDDSYILFSYLGNSKDLKTPETCNGSSYIIGDSAFKNSDINSIELSEGVTKIDDLAFSNAESLTKVKLSSTVTEIDALAFLGCVNLDFIFIPKTVEKIGKYVFGTIDENDVLVIHCEAKSRPSKWDKNWVEYAEVSWGKTE